MSFEQIYREPLSERDKKFREEMKDAMKNNGFHYLARIILDKNEPILEEQRQQWILADRKRFAKWKLNHKQKEERLAKVSHEREEKRNNEYISYLLNNEYETLYANFWKEAPIMRPYERPNWFKYRWPEYYWSNTKYSNITRRIVLQKEFPSSSPIIAKEDDLTTTEHLWFDLPEIPKNTWIPYGSVNTLTEALARLPTSLAKL